MSPRLDLFFRSDSEVFIHYNAGPAGFDPTTTGFGGLCKRDQHPILTGPRAPSPFVEDELKPN